MTDFNAIFTANSDPKLVRDSGSVKMHAPEQALPDYSQLAAHI